MSCAARTAGASSSTAARRVAAAATPARAAPGRRAMRTAAAVGGNSTEPEQQQRPRSLATLLVHSEGLVDDPYAASMPPIYQVGVQPMAACQMLGASDCSLPSLQVWLVP